MPSGAGSAIPAAMAVAGIPFNVFKTSSSLLCSRYRITIPAGTSSVMELPFRKASSKL